MTVEAYLDQRGIPNEGIGSWLIKNAPTGVEPDSCYLIGALDRDRPHLALEVVWTSGGIQKLEVHRRLGVRELWLWKNHQLTFFVLADDAYEQRADSRLRRGTRGPDAGATVTVGGQEGAARPLRLSTTRRRSHPPPPASFAPARPGGRLASEPRRVPASHHVREDMGRSDVR